MYLIIIYFLVLFLFIRINFYKIIHFWKSKAVILLQNNEELRWWGWLITNQAEVKLFYWIPYKFSKISFDEINNYSQNSFEPFYSYLTQDLFFRDVNFSVFNTKNILRFNEFYEKSLNKPKPDFWILINFSVFEKIFRVLPTINIRWIKLNSKNLFRWLSQLTTDSPDWLKWRKDILFKIWFILIPFLFIPFVIHYILWILFISKNKDFFIQDSWETFEEKLNYLAITENNLIWRKDNRYSKNNIQYNFFVDNFDWEYIYGKGNIIFSKTLFATDSFPISGKYTWSFWIESSEVFVFENPDYKIIELNNLENWNIKYNFSFKLPKNWEIKIVRQPWIKNTDLSVNFETKIFSYMPITNLKKKVDHWHNLDVKFNKNFILKYDIEYDKSPLKMVYRTIYDRWIFQINFQKQLKNVTKDNFEIIYNNKKVDISEIELLEDNHVIFIYYSNLDTIDYYPFEDRLNTAKLFIKNLEDISWQIHYQNWREIWFPWSKNYDPVKKERV